MSEHPDLIEADRFASLVFSTRHTPGLDADWWRSTIDTARATIAADPIQAPQCWADDCERATLPHSIKGLCSTCYRRSRRHDGDANARSRRAPVPFDVVEGETPILAARGYSAHEIAEHLGTRLDALRVRYRRAGRPLPGPLIPQRVRS